MYTGVLDQNVITNFFAIKTIWGQPRKIKIFLVYRITSQARHINVPITALHELHLQKKIEMVNTRSNMQIYDLNSKPRGVKSLRDIIDHAIGLRFYPPPGPEHYKLLQIEWFHGPYHINDNHKKNNETTLSIIVYCAPSNLREYPMYKNHFTDYVHLRWLNAKIPRVLQIFCLYF